MAVNRSHFISRPYEPGQDRWNANLYGARQSGAGIIFGDKAHISRRQCLFGWSGVKPVGHNLRRKICPAELDIFKQNLEVWSVALFG